MFNTSQNSQNKGFNISTNSTDKNNNCQNRIRASFDVKFNNKSFNKIKLSNDNNNNSSSKNNNYLKCRKWDYLNEDNEISIEHKKKLIFQKINKEKMNEIIDDIKLSELNEKFNDSYLSKPSIGTLNSLNYLIEDTYYSCPAENEILLSDKLKLKPYVDKYRKIRKDGNCFFRAIIFDFLENIILSKKIMLMKELLILFDEKISLENPKIKNKDYIIDNIKTIGKENIIIILTILINYMDEEFMDKDDELSAYIILLKVFLNCPEFDYGMVFFTRYLIYEFISENEKKILSQDNKVEIGYLLPDKYILEQNGKYVYLFEDFYKELIKMEQPIDKIGAIISPYVFDFNLNVLEYNYGTENNIIQEFPHKSRKYTNYELFEINLLFKDNQYDIYYKKYFYEKYYKDMDILIDNKEKLSILKSQVDANNNNNNDKKISNYSFGSKLVKLANSRIIHSGPDFKISKTINSSDGSDNNTIKKKSTEIEKRKERKEKTYIIKNSLKDNSISLNVGIPICLNCKNEYNPINSDFGLCQNCVIISLKDEILTAYFTYLQKGYTKDCEEKLNNFISKIKIKTNLGKKIYLDTAIRNNGFTFKNLFNELKQTLCLYCGSSIENNKYYLECPCKCKICKKECFKQYMNHIEDMNKIVFINGNENEMCIIPMTECPCGYKYKLKSFLTIIDELDKINEKSYKKIYEEQIKNNWKWICMVCKQNFNKNNKYFRLLLSDDKMNKNILKKLELKHLICTACYTNEKIEKKNNEIYCQFCDSKHTIDYVKFVNENNKTESACILI